MTDIAGQTIYEMISYNGEDARRINHSLKVYALTKCIICAETDDLFLREAATLAAIMHDIGIHVCEIKYGSCSGKYQEIEGPIVARQLFNKTDIKENVLDRVLYLIAHHHTYNDIDGLDYQALVEADFIVNLEEEKSDRDAILAALKNIFKTDTGISILKSMLI